MPNDAIGAAVRTACLSYHLWNLPRPTPVLNGIIFIQYQVSLLTPPGLLPLTPIPFDPGPLPPSTPPLASLLSPAASPQPMCTSGNKNERNGLQQPFIAGRSPSQPHAVPSLQTTGEAVWADSGKRIRRRRLFRRPAGRPRQDHANTLASQT